MSLAALVSLALIFSTALIPVSADGGDTTPPVVQGVTEGSTGGAAIVTFDEGTATLNGELFTNGTKIQKTGNYTLIVTDSSNNSTTIHFEVVTPGDTNGDGLTDVQDLVLVKRHILKIQLLSGSNLKAAEIIKQNSVSILDLLSIKKQILGFIYYSNLAEASNGALLFTNEKSYIPGQQSIKLSGSRDVWTDIILRDATLMNDFVRGDTVRIKMQLFINGNSNTINLVKANGNFALTQLPSNQWVEAIDRTDVREDATGKYIKISIHNASPTDKIFLSDIKVSPMDWTFDNYNYSDEDFSHNNGILSVSTERTYNASAKSLKFTGSPDTWSTIKFYNESLLKNYSVNNNIRIKLHVFVDGTNGTINLVKADGNYAINNLENGKWTEVIFNTTVKENIVGKYFELTIHNAIPSDKIYFDDMSVSSMDWTFENINFSENDYSHNNGNLSISTEKAYAGTKSLKFTGSPDTWSVLSFYNADVLNSYQVGDIVKARLNVLVDGNSGTVNIVNSDGNFALTSLQSNIWNEIVVNTEVKQNTIGKYIQFIVHNATPTDKVYFDSLAVEKIDWTFENNSFTENDYSHNNGTLSISSEKAYEGTKSLKFTGSDTWSVLTFYNRQLFSNYAVGDIVRAKMYMFIDGSNGAVNILNSNSNFVYTGLESGKWLELTVNSEIKQNSIGKYIQFIVNDALANDKVYIDNLSITPIDWTFESGIFSEDDYSHSSGSLSVSTEKAYQGTKSLKFTNSPDGWSVLTFYNNELLRNYSTGDAINVKMNMYIDGNNGTINLVKADDTFALTYMESGKWIGVSADTTVGQNSIGKYIRFTIHNAVLSDKVYFDNISIKPTKCNFEGYSFSKSDFVNNNGLLSLSTERAYSGTHSLKFSNSSDGWSTISIFNNSLLNNFNAGDNVSAKVYMYVDGSNGTINIVKPDGSFAATGLASGTWTEVTINTTVKANSSGKYIQFTVHNISLTDKLYMDNISIS